MRNQSSRIVRLMRCLAFAAVAGVFLVANLAAAEQRMPSAAHSAATATISLQLHSSPNFQGAAQGLRQSSPEEVQRIEELGARQKFARQNDFNDALANDSALAFSTKSCLNPLNLLELACLQANLISFAHAYLTARYPIPPPSASR